MKLQLYFLNTCAAYQSTQKYLNFEHIYRLHFNHDKMPKARKKNLMEVFFSRFWGGYGFP